MTEGTMTRRVAILTGDDDLQVQTKVNLFLSTLPPENRDLATVLFSTSVWDSEGVIFYSVLIDYPVIAS